MLRVLRVLLEGVRALNATTLRMAAATEELLRLEQQRAISAP